MDKHEMTLRLWKEARPDGRLEQQLELFSRIRDRVQQLPEGLDLIQTTEIIIRMKGWFPLLTVEQSLELVVRAVAQGHEPARIEDVLRFLRETPGGFSRVNLPEFIFKYTLAQLRSIKLIWDTLPPQDRAALHVEALLAAGLEDHPEVVALVLQELQSLQGIGLKIAALLKDSASPAVAFELWRSLRKPGPIQIMDLDLLARAVQAVGNRPHGLDTSAPLMAVGEDGDAVLYAPMN